MKIEPVLWKCVAIIPLFGVSCMSQETNGQKAPSVLVSLKKKFQESPDLKTEDARQAYLVKLLNLWWEDHFDKKTNFDTLVAINDEIVQYPAPEGSIFFKNKILGDWESPRHGYRFNADGTWIMLPASDCTTHGTWSIKEGRFFQSANVDGKSESLANGIPVILLNGKYFVFGAKKAPYILHKIPNGSLN